MFKNTFLRWRTNNARKKNKSIRASLPYPQAMSIGVLFTVEDKAKHDEVKRLVKVLETEGKKVRVLEFLPRKKENYDFLFDFFTIDELSFWGSLQSDKALHFADTTFDYLFNLDTEPNDLIDYLLARSKAHCRVGVY
ncbi:MAG: DUF6913 domain-containing protein, partial [Cyclobacteriaceae bacterium]